MKSVLDFVKWLLAVDIRAKNAASLLIALLAVVVFYVLARSSEWFWEIRCYGWVAVAAALIVVFFVVWLSVGLLYSGLAACRQRAVIRGQRREESERRVTKIRQNLLSLTDWQWQFVLRFIVEGRAQIHEHEIGVYRALWEDELRVLVSKGIVRRHLNTSVYELDLAYREYLEQNWDPESGALA